MACARKVKYCEDLSQGIILLSLILSAVFSVGGLAVPADWPNCDFHCTAKDILLTEAYLVLPGGDCTPGSLVTAEIWGAFKAKNTRYALWLLADVYQDGAWSDRIEQCLLDSIPKGETEAVLGLVGWECGTQLELRNVIVSWTSKNESCADLPDCTDRKAKCSWISLLGIEVEAGIAYLNHPPIPDAGGPYEGRVGEPIWLDASLTFEYDLEDDLEYRWDIDYDGLFDTDWSKEPLTLTTWSEPYQGMVTLEVRDLFQGAPTGEVVEATAFALVHEVLDLHAGVFYDANGNGAWEEGETGLSGIPLVLDGEIELVTEADGGTVFRDVDPGWHGVMLPDAALSQLASSGYMPMETSSRLLNVVSGEPAAALFPVRQGTGKISGIVFFDDGGDGVYDPGEPPVSGVQVLLTDGRRTVTDPRGRFFFLQVPPGEHRLQFAGPKGRSRSRSVSIRVGEEISVSMVWPQETKGFLKVNVEAGGGD